MDRSCSFNFIKKMVLLLCVFMLSALSAYANNSLLGINVEQTANDTYNIVLKADSSTKITKHVESKDNLTLFLNSIIPSDSIDIVYDNASDLDNVIVQKRNSDNTIILLQGKNIHNANIYVKELSTGVLKPYDSNSLSNYLYVGNVKYFVTGVAGLVLIFLLMIALRPKSKKYTHTANVQQKVKYSTTTIRAKQQIQKRYVPSINYKVANTRTNMTVPKDFVISAAQKYNEERIRKAG